MGEVSVVGAVDSETEVDAEADEALEIVVVGEADEGDINSEISAHQIKF